MVEQEERVTHLFQVLLLQFQVQDYQQYLLLVEVEEVII